MAHLGMDLDAAVVLAADLRRLADQTQPVMDHLAAAQQLSELSLGLESVIDQLAHDCLLGASAVSSAMAELRQFRVQLVEPSRPPIAGPAGSTPWNEVHQVASHNSYAVAGGIAALYDQGVRAFEVDVHRGAPTRLFPTPRRPWFPSFGELLSDHLDHGGGRPGDWRVYHHSAGPHSEYRYLSEALRVVAALPRAEPVTLFVDVKDDLGGAHDAAALDALLEQHLGERLFRPDDLRNRAGGALALADAVAEAGWPTVHELHGRVLVVVTDRTDGYDPSHGSAFVAAPPVLQPVDGALELLAPDDVVFYNVDHRRIEPEAIESIAATGAIVRTFFGSRCDIGFVDQRRPEPNYRAVDLAVGDEPCPDPSPAPVDTPVPQPPSVG